MNCPKCGNLLPEGSDFCQYCGAKVLGSEINERHYPNTAQNNTLSADEVTNSQKFFDDDYGYSSDNPIVTSSITSVGHYLRGLRTEDGKSFTWSRKAQVYGSSIIEYELYLEGALFGSIFFNPTGKDCDYTPRGLLLDNFAIQASKRGMSQNEYKLKRQAAKKAKKTAIILICLLAITAGSVLLYTTYREDILYSIATRCFENAKYDEAANVFARIPNYKDAEEQHINALIKKGESLYLSKNYSEAINAFGDVVESEESFKATYKYSNKFIQLCNGQISLGNKQYREALNSFITLDDEITASFPVDSEIAECNYYLMQDAVQEKEWANAYSYLVDIEQSIVNEQFDCSKYSYEIIYNYVQEELSKKNYSAYLNALDGLNMLIKEHGENAEILAMQSEAQNGYCELAYNEGVKYFKEKEYESAVKYLEKIIKYDYEDSKTYWLESMYKYIQYYESLKMAKQGSLDRAVFDEVAPIIKKYKSELIANQYKEYANRY